MSGRIKLFVICGERSGSNMLNYILEDTIKNLSEKQLKELNIAGVVYNDISEKFNIKQILSPKEISFIGFGDILYNIPKIMDNINKVAKEIINFNPDIVLSIDAYDFCIRVAKKVRKLTNYKISNHKNIIQTNEDFNNNDFEKILKQKNEIDINQEQQNIIHNKNFNQNSNTTNTNDNIDNIIQFWHIVAPSVWAYWSWRAKILSKYYNRLFYLLPFEKKYFKPLERTGNNGFESIFIGYPATFQNIDTTIEKDKNLIGITIGSRKGEIKRHKDLILETILKLKIINKNYKFVILATKDTSEMLKNIFQSIKNVIIISDENEKKIAIQRCQIIIAKSGTNNVEIGALKTPMIVYYKVSILTYLFAKIFAKIKLINLFNITIGKMFIPELVQKKATADNLVKNTYEILNNNTIIKNQLIEIETAIKEMQCNNKEYPLNIVAKELTDFLKEAKNNK